MNRKKAKTVILVFSLFWSLLAPIFFSATAIATTEIENKEEPDHLIIPQAQIEADTNTRTNREVKAVRNDYVSINLDTNKISLLLSKTDLVTDSANVTVKTSHYSGYTLSFNIKNDYDGLKNHQDNSKTIPAITETVAAPNFPTLGWGYTFDEDSNKVFHPAPLENTTVASSSINGSQNYPLTIGARVDGSLPQGSYGNTLTFTAVANPLTVAICNPDAKTIYEAVCMQDMNSDIIASMPTGIEYQLIDVRDQKQYSIMADDMGAVMMLQNLDLDLSTGVTLTKDTTDLNSKDFWTPNITRVDDYYDIVSSNEKYNAAIENGKISADKAIMYELGDYYYTGGYHTFNYQDENNLFMPNTEGKLTYHDDKDLHECYYADGEYEGNPGFFKAYLKYSRTQWYNCDDEIVPVAVENPLGFGKYFTADSTVNPKGHIGNLYSAAAVVAVDNINDMVVKDKVEYLGNDYINTNLSTDSICPRNWHLLKPNDSKGKTDFPYYNSLTHPVRTEYATRVGREVNSQRLIIDSQMPNFDTTVGIYGQIRINEPAQLSVRCGITTNVFQIKYYASSYDYNNGNGWFTDYTYSLDNVVYLPVTDIIPKSGYEEFLGWTAQCGREKPEFAPGDTIRMDTSRSTIYLCPVFERAAIY